MSPVAAAAATAANTPTMDSSSFPQDASMTSSPNLLSPTGGWGNHHPAAAAALEYLEWSPDEIRRELRRAVGDLSHRCLKLAAKWASEQLLGLPPDSNDNNNEDREDTVIGHNNALLLPGTDREWYAKSLLELGEYSHAAAILSQPPPDHNAASIEAPLEDLSAYGVYLRAYALFLAGERRKEEETLELREPLERTSVCNPYLAQLRKELEQAYQDRQLDAFGLYVYGMVLKESPPQPQRQAYTLLLESIEKFPFNWSAWLDLAQLCCKDPKLVDAVEESLPDLHTHFMYSMFCAHFLMETQSHAQALAVLDRLHGTDEQPLFSNSTYLQAKVAVAHYHQRDFEAADAYFANLLDLDAHRLEDLDVYSNILYVQDNRPALSQLAHLAVRVDKYRPETCCIVGNHYSLLQQRTKAVQYFQRALKLDGTYTSAWTLMGHEYVELKHTAAAMEAYRRAVDVSPRDYRAWYGLGQTYEFLGMHLYALFYYRRAAVLRPYDARMWCAMGGCYLALHKKADAIRCYRRAMTHDDVEGIATQKLAALYRQDGQTEQAAQCYMQHLEFRYRATAEQEPGGETDVPLQVILNEVVVQATEAEALLFLAGYYRDNSEYEMAALCCSRLLEYPGPQKEEGKALLREIRSRRERSSGPPESPRRSSGVRPRISRETTPRSRNDSSSSFSMEFSP